MLQTLWIKKVIRFVCMLVLKVFQISIYWGNKMGIRYRSAPMKCLYIIHTYIYIWYIIYPAKSAIYMRIRPILNIRRTDQFPFRKNIFLSLYLTNSILYREVLLLVVMYDTLSDNTTGDRIIALLYLMHIFWKIVTP